MKTYFKNPGIMESNALPEPEWAKEYKQFLINKFGISNVDAVCAVGELEKLMRVHRKKIDEQKLDDMSNDYFFMKYHDEGVRDIYKAGYRDGFNRK